MKAYQRRFEDRISYLVWSEDDAGTPDREKIDAAWLRLFHEDRPKQEVRSRHVDRGDSFEDWFFVGIQETEKGEIFRTLSSGGDRLRWWSHRDRR